MPDIRSEYPFQVSWHGGQDDPMFVIRTETIEEFREGVALIAEAWASVTGQAPTEVVPSAPQETAAASAPEPSPTPSERTGQQQSAANRPILKLPLEALEALKAQKRGLCLCQEKWWDNRKIKTKESQPDFKCTKCGYGVWLKPSKSEDA